MACPPSDLARRYRTRRELTLALCERLSDADASVQSMPDASPAKWHLAHTAWFFETFVLRDHVAGYRAFDPRYAFLFNSYYEAEGARHPRDRRGMITRPTLDEVRDWRAHVDAAMLAALPGLDAAACALVALGLEHEAQHQELLLTDMLHLFAQNPLGPALFDEPLERVSVPTPRRWVAGRDGVVEVGAAGDAFAFDCETPRHRVLLSPHAIASTCVTNGEWDAFVADRGYATPVLWLADGWNWVQREAIAAPAYWRDADQFTLAGWQRRDAHAPVCHISLYEADAFATWAGARLPTEFEWEAAATEPEGGHQLDDAAAVRPRGGDAWFGDVWQWTGSGFRPYPGFRTIAGAVGEYNGKFMSGQFVLKGASCATPRGSSRTSYRNFFYPQQRWQFTGLRLARDV